MGVGPDGACGAISGGGDSCAHSTAEAPRASASETGARILAMAAGWYHAKVVHRSAQVDWQAGEPTQLMAMSQTGNKAGAFAQGVRVFALT
jgi:hypothetical protein